MALLFVVCEPDALSCLAPFFYFLIFYPIKVPGLYCQFFSLLQVSGEGSAGGLGEMGWGGGMEGRRDGASHCPAAGTMHWMLGAILCRQLSKVLVPRHHPLDPPPHLSKHKASNFRGVPCRRTGINVTVSFDYWQSHSQRIS